MHVQVQLKRTETVGDLLDHLGGISPSRLRLSPPLGQATEKDLLRLQKRDNRLYELVDGTLVEKPVGQVESILTLDLARHMGNYLEESPVGYLAGPDAGMRLWPGLVRLPDISFISFEQTRKPEINTEAIAPFAPFLAVEIVSEGNTIEEIARKRHELFQAGTRMMWVIYPMRRTVEVWTAPDQCVTLTEDQTLKGEAIPPGFELPLKQLFAKLPANYPRSSGKGRPRKPGKRRGKK
jgi:Uma2 family endonuclease